MGGIPRIVKYNWKISFMKSKLSLVKNIFIKTYYIWKIFEFSKENMELFSSLRVYICERKIYKNLLQRT